MKRSMIIALAAGALVLILLWYFLLFSPTSSDLNDTRDEVAEAQRQQQELENTVRRLKELSRNSVQQEAELRTLRAAIPENPDLGSFILQANEIASTSGIDWLSISPSPPVANTTGANSTISIAIQINGGFFQLLDYLNRLEDLDRLVILDNVSVSAGAAEGGTEAPEGAAITTDSTTGAPTLSVTLTGRMFTTAQAAPPTGSSSGTTTTPTPTPTPSATSPSATGAS